MRNATISHDSKHPYILPKDVWLYILLYDYFHLRYLHLVQSMTQRKYWIIGARSLIRSRIHKCLRCHKLRAQLLQLLMSNLSSARITPSRPFSHVGTKFAGSFSLKLSGRRNSSISKGYLCVFVCFASKAVHFEFVSALSTNAFIATLDRFVARRDLPEVIYSDCGSNFKGTARHLNEVTSLLNTNHDSLYDYFTLQNTNWKFNPPAAPNFGGLWEAVIKSTKFLLKRTLNSSAYMFEEYITFLLELKRF